MGALGPAALEVTRTCRTRKGALSFPENEELLAQPADLVVRDRPMEFGARHHRQDVVGKLRPTLVECNPLVDPERPS